MTLENCFCEIPLNKLGGVLKESDSLVFYQLNEQSTITVHVSANSFECKSIAIQFAPQAKEELNNVYSFVNSYLANEKPNHVNSEVVHRILYDYKNENLLTNLVTKMESIPEQEMKVYENDARISFVKDLVRWHQKRQQAFLSNNNNI